MNMNDEFVIRAAIFGRLADAFGFSNSTETIKESVRLTSDISMEDLKRCASNIVQENKRPACITGAIREAYDTLRMRRFREASSPDSKVYELSCAAVKTADDAGLPTKIDTLFNSPGLWKTKSHVTGRTMGPANQPSELLIGHLVSQHGPDWPENMSYPPDWVREMERTLGSEWRRVWPRPEGWPPFAENPRPSAKRLQGEMP